MICACTCSGVNSSVNDTPFIFGFPDLDPVALSVGNDVFSCLAGSTSFSALMLSCLGKGAVIFDNNEDIGMAMHCNSPNALRDSGHVCNAALGISPLEKNIDVHESEIFSDAILVEHSALVRSYQAFETHLETLDTTDPEALHLNGLH
nr:hypothetical protein Iba_chr09fCG13530 [Ipomoea batatas]